MTNTNIILNNLSFHLEHTHVKFEKVNLAFEKQRYGIVGANGIGKTTLLKLILGELTPDAGSIQRNGLAAYASQAHSTWENSLVSDALEVTSIIEALARINAGSVTENDFETVGSYWDIESKIEQALAELNLWPLDINQPFANLSGGQKTKILLAKTMLFPSDFILLDEPTNNLDKHSREILYHFIENSHQDFIIVSHDRALLNKLDKIIEINQNGFDCYSGNYDFYREQKRIKQQAIQQKIQARTEQLTHAKKLIQTRMERHQQNESRGKKSKASQLNKGGSFDKMAMDKKNEQSEQTNRRIRQQSQRKLDRVNQILNQAQSELGVTEEINATLGHTKIPQSKIILEVSKLCFSYNPHGQNLLNDLSFQMIGPERVAVTGSNGCGKSTLLKLIRNKLMPSAGEIKIGAKKIAYLDQEVRLLDCKLNLIDNFLKHNPEAKVFDAYSALAFFKFRNSQAMKNAGELSGGEKIRAGLAISLMSKQPPELIILDETTNHLDINAIESIEKALCLYRGAILAVSHDENFLRNININQTIPI